jgi:hypothetical protein
MPDDTSFDTIAQMIEQATGLPLGTLRSLSHFDLQSLIDAKLKIVDKDKARIIGFVPAVLQRAADLGVTVGYQIGLKQALNEGMTEDNLSIQKGEGFDQLVKEAGAILTAYYNQGIDLTKDPLGEGFDPFKDERQELRIFAKRNGLNAGYQTLLGVSDATPTEYPAEYVEKYLS